MSIEITDHGPVKLTQAEYDKYYSEYKKLYSESFNGMPPTFENWLRGRLNESTNKQLLVE